MKNPSTLPVGHAGMVLKAPVTDLRGCRYRAYSTDLFADPVHAIVGGSDIRAGIYQNLKWNVSVAIPELDFPTHP